MKKSKNRQQDTPITDTFKGLLLMSMGVPVGNIRPYRLKSAPSCFGGFERMTVAAARALGVDIPKTEKENDEVYIRQLPRMDARLDVRGDFRAGSRAEAR